MAEENIMNAIKVAKEKSKKRNFKQSFDIAVNLKNVDLRNRKIK